MSSQNFFESSPTIAARAPASDRAQFIRRTYLHLGGAIACFAGLEFFLFSSGVAEALVPVLTSSRWTWLLVLGLFMGTGWIADRWARRASSPVMAYGGLALFVVAEAIFFLPMLYMAAHYSDPLVIPVAGLVTAAAVLGITATAFITRVDFSFIRTALTIGSFVAMGFILAAIVFGFSFGSLFALFMVALSGGYIVYSTSQMQFHYRTDQHVSAALGLFSSVAMMFYHLLMLFSPRE